MTPLDIRKDHGHLWIETALHSLPTVAENHLNMLMTMLTFLAFFMVGVIPDKLCTFCAGILLCFFLFLTVFWVNSSCRPCNNKPDIRIYTH